MPNDADSQTCNGILGQILGKIPQPTLQDAIKAAVLQERERCANAVIAYATAIYTGTEDEAYYSDGDVRSAFYECANYLATGIMPEVVDVDNIKGDYAVRLKEPVAVMSITPEKANTAASWLRDVMDISHRTKQ